jgi:hypothetical protein
MALATDTDLVLQLGLYYILLYIILRISTLFVRIARIFLDII